jgi:hypothetical protein
MGTAPDIRWLAGIGTCCRYPQVPVVWPTDVSHKLADKLQTLKMNIASPAWHSIWNSSGKCTSIPRCKGPVKLELTISHPGAADRIHRPPKIQEVQPHISAC